jgi:uncharacterized membrane protein
MSEWWKTAKKILSGKAKGSKLMVLGVFLVTIGVVLTIYYPLSWGSAFVILGILAFVRGLVIYEKEATDELERRKTKNTN